MIDSIAEAYKKIEELEDQVAYYKHELGLTHKHKDLAILMDQLKLAPIESKLVLTMFKRRGQMVTFETLIMASGSESEEFTNYLAVRMSLIRRKLGREAIRNYWGFGYGLEPEGMAKVQAALDRG